MIMDDLGAGRLQSWQLRQAADAVTLYCGQFSEENATPGRKEVDSAEAVAEPSEALREMGRLLRLRHYSGGTERTYLGWARRCIA
jgi:hypothetical protein